MKSKLSGSDSTIHLFEPSFNEEEIKAVTNTLKSKFWASGAGIGKVKKFEELFTKYIGCKNTIAVNSGTAALHLSIGTLNITKKEVLLPSLTFVSTACSVLYNNAKPKFVYIDETLCIDLDDLEKKINSNSGLIIPVHFGGIP